MRELKFRIYNPKVKEIGEAFTLIEAMTDEFAMSDDLVYMQYTGLKDKNGVEIYEGDILAGNWIVVWHESGFYLHVRELFNDTIYLPMQKNQQSEIIGNIYENAELEK